MYRKLLVLLSVLLITSQVMAFELAKDKKEDKKEGICPTTQMTKDCLTCHVLVKKDGKVKWGLKEVKPFSDLSIPYGADIKILDGETVGWYDFETVEDKEVRKAIEYFISHGIKKVIVNIDSYGGSAFDGYAIVNIFEMYRGKIEIVTQVQSYGLSAGFLVFVGGHKRIASPMATLMWHEISYGEWLKIITPSGSEEDAKIMRKLQDTANAYLAKRSNLSKKEIDEKIRLKAWWMNGVDALKYGFADELLPATNRVDVGKR